jgi:hypothetical protein
MISHWAYILVGENDTGKTSFQRYLIEALCSVIYKRLTTNIVSQVVHPRAPRNFATLFTANRSYQEKVAEYLSVERYFKHYFQDAHVCILSSHAHGSCADDIKAMIEELHCRAYNVGGVFWSNSFENSSKEICKLSWQERLWISNPTKKGPEKIQAQIKERADAFADLLIERAKLC